MDKKESAIRRKKTKEEAFSWNREIKFAGGASEAVETKEKISENEKIIAEQLRKEIEAMEIDENLKEEAKKKAEKIDFLGEKQKIEHLLEIAKKKGIIFAVNVAKDMKDPYILDIFHDILAQKEYYKKFTK